MVTRVRRIIQEIIGSPQRIVRRFFTRFLGLIGVTFDVGTADYAFWDRARHGKARGLEISGLLLKPIESKIASWVIGNPPAFKLEPEGAADGLNDWWQRNHAQILSAYEDAVGLGDYFLVVNPDQSVTVVPPHVVRSIVDPNDFGKVIGWRIEERFPHPDDSRTMTVVDEWTATTRVRTVSIDNREVRAQTFRNVIGRVPVIHIPNKRQADERFGRPEGEALQFLLHRYGETIEAALDGNKKQGRPTPVVEKMGSEQSVEAFWQRFGKTATQELPDGTTEQTQYLEIDSDQVLTLGGDASFRYAQPGSFAGDTQVLLQLLFYLYLQHIELPEWILGNAIASSRASAETQIEPMVKFIEKKRAFAQDWVDELNLVVLAYQGVIAPNTATAETPKTTWDSLTKDDEQLKLEAVKYAHGEQHIITDETALRQLPLDIEDIPGEIEKAQQEKDERAEKDQEASAQRAVQQANANATRDDNNAENPPDQQPEPAAQNGRSNGNARQRQAA